jgi:acetyltransferase-like isoleucine patch superfamily enzyme
MSLSKYFWAFRLFIYSVVYKDIHFPGYMGKPIILIGLNKLKIDSRVRIFPNSRFEIYDTGSIYIQSNCSIGQGFHATSKGSLLIGGSTVISGNVIITNIDHEYRQVDVPILEQPYLVKDTSIGENCFIGYGSVIQAGTKLGKHCVVGANSVVRGVFPDYSVIAGAPAKIIKQYNKVSQKWERV